jgi:hypothetical protein
MGTGDKLVAGALAVTGTAAAVSGINQTRGAIQQTGQKLLDIKTMSPGQMELANLNKPTTTWTKFMAFVHKKSPEFFKKFYLRLAQASVMATIPLAGWPMALLNLGFTGLALYELWDLWKEFNNVRDEGFSPEMVQSQAALFLTPQKDFVTNPNVTNGAAFGAYANTGKRNTSPTASQVPSSGGVGMALPKGVSINSKSAIDYLVSKGLTPAQAAGVVGNLIQESTLNSGAFNKSEGAYGLAQWRGSRLQDLQQFASSRGKDIGDVNTQLDFIMHELSGKERKAGAMLASSTTAEEAAFNFGKYYERPKVVEQSRVQYANTALKEYGAGGNTTGSDLMNAATNAAANKANITGGNTIISAPTTNNNAGTGGNVNLPSAGAYDTELIRMLFNRASGNFIFP